MNANTTTTVTTSVASDPSLPHRRSLLAGLAAMVPVAALSTVPAIAAAAVTPDPIFAAIEAHAKADDEFWTLYEELLAVGPENAGHLPIEATVVAEFKAARAMIDTAPTTHAGLRALEAHLRADRHYTARGFIGVPCGRGFAHHFDGAENQKSVDWLIAKRAAEIDSAA